MIKKNQKEFKNHIYLVFNNMKRSDYKNYVWYPLTDDEYWVEDYPDEFPNCRTIICCTRPEIAEGIFTYQSAFMGWGTMAKYGEWKFMIIEKPL